MKQYVQKNETFDSSTRCAFYFPNIKLGGYIFGFYKKIKTNDNLFFINIENNKYATFAYMLKVMAHEMLHCYDMNFGVLSMLTLLYIN